MVVLQTVWCGCRGKHGGTEDCMMDQLGEAWRYWGRHGGSHGGHVADIGECVQGVLGYAWWYWGQYGGITGGRVALLGSSMVGALADAWRYWGVPLTPGTTQGGYWGIHWPLKQTRGTVPAGMYIA